MHSFFQESLVMHGIKIIRSWLWVQTRMKFGSMIHLRVTMWTHGFENSSWKRSVFVISIVIESLCVSCSFASLQLVVVFRVVLLTHFSAWFSCEWNWLESCHELDRVMRSWSKCVRVEICWWRLETCTCYLARGDSCSALCQMVARWFVDGTCGCSSEGASSSWYMMMEEESEKVFDSCVASFPSCCMGFRQEICLWNRLSCGSCLLLLCLEWLVCLPDHQEAQVHRALPRLASEQQG